MLEQETPAVSFRFDFTPALDLNTATRIEILLSVNNNPILKYNKTGVGTGIDGAIIISPSNQANAVPSPAQALKLGIGSFMAEIVVEAPYTGFPGGARWKQKAIIDNITKANIQG